MAMLYTAIIIFLICIPTYFYTQSELRNYKFNQNKILEVQNLNIQRAIYDFSDSSSNIFHFPKSFSIQSYLLDKNSHPIFSTSKESLSYENKIYKKSTLSHNRLNASYLIITKDFSYKEIYLKISTLTLSIGLFIFISAYLILKQSISPYKKANEYLDAFFNDAMHELKTPLGVIQLNLELLEEKQKNSKEIKRSLNGVKNLLLVYEDIEYLIKDKQIIYEKEKIDFSVFVQHRIEMFQSLAQSKTIILNSQIKEDVFLFFNRTQLQRIIDNTISNAIKYSYEKSQVNITLDKEDNISFSVEDFGQGIKDTSKIFNRYHRENSIKGGFGIGLNIVKNICDEYGVFISVKSTLKQGSTFNYSFKS